MSISSISSTIASAARKIKPLDVATRGAGALALFSVLYESNKIGANRASQKSKVYEADKMIRLGMGVGKLNYESPKYNKIKNHIYNNPILMGKAWNGIKGYLEGAAEGITHNALTAGFSILALVSKHKITKITSLVGLLAAIGCNFVVHGTNMFEKTDELE